MNNWNIMTIKEANEGGASTRAAISASVSEWMSASQLLINPTLGSMTAVLGATG